MGKGRTVPAAAAGGLLREPEVGTAGDRASAGPSPFSRPPTRGRSGRADGRREDLGAGTPHPGTRGLSRPPRAGGCPGAGGTPRLRNAGCGRGRGAAWPLACPSPLRFPPSSSATGRGRGSFFTFLTSPLPPLQSNLRRAEVPPSCARRLAGAGLLLWRDWLRAAPCPVTSLPPSGLWAGETLALVVAVGGGCWDEGR